ncbi:MAG: type 1 glutamine amidotransferase [Desulfobulbus sp.]
MSNKILIFQHAEWQKPGPIIWRVAEEAGVTLRVVQVWRESAADFAEFDALILLGGDCEVARVDRCPFLNEEKRLVRAWMNLNKPCLGFNLGYHLLAEAAGATIGSGPVASLGIIDGHITHEGRLHPLFRGIRTPCKLFKWHEQVVQSPLPRSMVLLATSKDCMVEACCLEGRPHIVGLQCDNYAAIPEDLDGWLRHGNALVNRDKRGRSFAEELMGDARGLAAGMAADFGVLLRNFVSLIK